jgi:hypothetical protein
MEQIRAFRSLNKTIYDTIEAAREGDKKWIEEKLADDLTMYLREKLSVEEKIKMVAKNREKVIEILRQYDQMEKESSELGA